MNSQPASSPRHVIIANTLSSFGSAMAMFSLAWLSYQLSGSLLVSIIVISAGTIPAVLLMQTSARLSSRFDPRSIAASAMLVMAVGVFLLAWLIWLGFISVWLLLAATLLSGTVNAIYSPAYNLILKSTTDRGKLDQLDASLASWGAVASGIGLIAGGLLIDRLGAAGIFAIDAASYLPLIFVFLRLTRSGKASTPESSETSDPASHVKLRETISLIVGTPLLRRVITLTVIFQLLAWPLTRSFQHVATVVLENPVTFAALLLAFQFGVMLVSPMMKRARRSLSYSAIAYRAAVALTGALILVAISGLLPSGLAQLISIMLILVPFGLGVSLAAALLQACMQVGAPDVKEASVLAVYAGFGTLAGTIGGIALGQATALISIWVVIGVEALVLVLLMFIAHRNRWFMDLDSATPIDAEHPAEKLLRHHHSRFRQPLVNHGTFTTPLLVAEDRVAQHRPKERTEA